MLDYKHAIRGVVAGATFHYGEANNKYMHDYNETKESIYIQYIKFNNQQRLPLTKWIAFGGFEYVRYILIFTKCFMTKYYKNSDFGYTLVVDVDYPEYLELPRISRQSRNIKK